MPGNRSYKRGKPDSVDSLTNAPLYKRKNKKKSSKKNRTYRGGNHNM